MSQRKESTPEELAASRETRIAIRLLDHQQRYLSLLHHAQRIRINSNLTDTLTDIIAAGEVELQGLRTRAGGKVSPRRRPQKKILPVEECSIFIDECGSSSLTDTDTFEAFIIAAIIVTNRDYQELNKQWKQWKRTKLGSAKKIIHEPDVRKGRGPFYFNGNRAKRDTVIQSLHEHIANLDFAGIACVVHRKEYIAQIGLNCLDESLPAHLYLMALDFLMERVVLILETQFDGANAHVIAEARGPLEDALLQYEYVRLQLDGTSYISPSWFRQQLAPAIEFKTKKDNCTGLQLADLLARPCGDKILDPTATPDRWPEFCNKLCSGQETSHSILGLKIVPWHEKYTGIWES